MSGAPDSPHGNAQKILNRGKRRQRRTGEGEGEGEGMVASVEARLDGGAADAGALAAAAGGGGGGKALVRIPPTRAR